MNRELLNQVIAAIDALIADELKATDALRYHRIAKLCDKAHDLLQMGAARVGEVADRPLGITRHINHEPFAFDNFDQGIATIGGIAGGIAGGGGNLGDAGDLIREMIAALSPVKDNKVHETATRALERLLDLRLRLADCGRDTTAIDAKIDKALADLEQAPLDFPNATAMYKRLKEAGNGNSNLAGTDLLRGHSAPGNGQRLLHAGDGEPDPTGAGGADGADEAGPEEGLDRG